jgi:hypothetical protein
MGTRFGIERGRLAATLGERFHSHREVLIALPWPPQYHPEVAGTA